MYRFSAVSTRRLLITKPISQRLTIGAMLSTLTTTNHTSSITPSRFVLGCKTRVHHSHDHKHHLQKKRLVGCYEHPEHHHNPTDPTFFFFSCFQQTPNIHTAKTASLRFQQADRFEIRVVYAILLACLQYELPLRRSSLSLV